MNKIMTILRSLLAVLVGLIAISLVTELIEFSVVTILNGSVTFDQNVYFEIRNRGPVLFLKFVYNTLAALLGGYITAWIAGRQEVSHGIALALVQTSSFIWGMTVSPYAQTTPFWVWFMLFLLMTPAILVGSMRRKKDKSRSSIQS